MTDELSKFEYYRDESAVVYCGKAEIILPMLEPVDLLLTDPPYVLTATGGGIGKQRKYLSDITGFTDGGFDMSLLDNFSNWICFCSKTQLIELLNKASCRRWMLITWNKPNPTPLSNGNYLPDTEYIVHSFEPNHLYGSYKDKSRYIVHPASQGLLHPNQKPLTVISKLIQLGSKVGDTILDCYAGSGTSLYAAKRLGRKAIGVEEKESYCEVIASRLRQSTLQFEPLPQTSYVKYGEYVQSNLLPRLSLTDVDEPGE